MRRFHPPRRTAQWAVGLALGLAVLTVTAASPSLDRPARAATFEAIQGATVAARSPSSPAQAPASAPTSWAGTTVSTLFPSFNGSLPGNFGSTAEDWEIGTPALDPRTDTVWWPTLPVSVDGTAKPVLAPAVLYSLNASAFVGIDRWVTNASAFVFDPATNLLYATDPLNATVQSIDPTTGHPTGVTYSVGSEPSAISYVAETGYLFVANTGSDSVTVINPVAGGGIVSPSLSAGKEPVALADDPKDDWMYVADSGASTVSLLNTSDLGESVSPTRLLAPADGIAYSAKTGYLAVSSFASQNVTVLTGATGAVAAVVRVNAGIRSISVSSDGAQFIISNSTSDSVSRMNASYPFRVSPTSVEVGTDPDQLLVVPDSTTIIVWNNESRNLSIVSAGPASESTANESLASTPTITAYDPQSGRLYVASPTSPEVAALDPYTGARAGSQIELPSPALTMSLTPNYSDLFLGLESEVEEYNTSTGLLVGQSALGSGPFAPLALDPQSHELWVGRPSLGEIEELNATTLAAAGPVIGVHTSASDTWGLVFYPPTGSILAINSTSGKLVEFNATTGESIGTISVGPNLTALAYDPPTGLVYAAGASLWTIDPSPFSVVGTAIELPTHNHVGGIEYESSRQALYLATWNNPDLPGSVIVVNGSSVDASAASLTVIPVGLEPAGLQAVEPARGALPDSGAILVSNPESGSISLLASPPEINSVRFVPNQVDAGAPTELLTIAQGGAGASTISFVGLPKGCGNSPAFTLVCVPTVPGNYTVVVSIRDSAGEKAASTAVLHVATALRLSATLGGQTPAEADVGLSIEMVAEASGGTKPYSFSWTLGDGASLNGSSIAYTYKIPGTFVVAVTATDADGGEVVNESVITVANVPTAKLTVEPRAVTDVDIPLTLVANVTGGSLPGSSDWTFGDGMGAGTSTATHSWSEAGNFEAQYTFTDRIGVTSPAASVEVKVNPQLTATFSATAATSSPQVGTEFKFLAIPSAGTPPYTAYWTFGDGSGAQGLQVNHSYGRSGYYNITVIAVDSAGDAVSSSFEEVQVVASPSHGTPLFGGGFGPSFALGLLVGAAVASVALFLAERSRRTGPPGPPSAYVPPAPVGRRGRD